MQNRREEILAKRARLAELKKQNELRQKDLHASRQSTGNSSELIAPTPGRVGSHKDIDKIISEIERDSRSSSTGPGSGPHSIARGSRPNSVLSAGELSLDNSDAASPLRAHGGFQSQSPTITLQTLNTAPLNTVYEYSPSPIKEVFSYSKGVQTQDAWTSSQRKSRDTFSESEEENSPAAVRSPKSNKRLSRRERDKEEELRQNIRKEIEDELRAIQGPPENSLSEQQVKPNFPARALTAEELGAVTSSGSFLDFIERSSKVIERALDEEYDVLADYSLQGYGGLDDEEDGFGKVKGRAGRKVKEHAQFYDERWSKKRMISGLGFSPKFPELVLASYTKNPSAPHDPDGLIQVWNLHLHDRSEYVFHAQSDILTAKFSPFHPNLIIGGAYNGQVLLWDTRAKSAPVQKTPLTGIGHTHPVYSIDVVGTQNANNIISCSTDGVVCGWTVDMLAQPQELLELTAQMPARTEDIAPTCISFPQSDPTFFLIGTEEGIIHPCHRYDRAGAKAGIDHRLNYRGHAAPIMSLEFHPAKGPIDLGDLVLSSSLDWSVKLWRARAPAATSSSAVQQTQIATPLLDITREDVIYDAAWSPVKPGIFALVDGAGSLEVWDITMDTEVPVAKVMPTARKSTGMFSRSLNKVKWEEHDGKRLAVGGLDGVVSVFDVGSELGGADNARHEEWTAVKKTIARLDAASLGASNGATGR
ncbi:MAG: hypothetical protein M1814_004086 [Vezdaea aestivalis]|nr:MAG: hypothetical protein M1814_004086 [Vezdaea aestivalis]